MGANDPKTNLIPLSSDCGGEDPTSKILSELEANHLRVSRTLEEFINRRRSFLHRLFPSKLDQVLADSQLNLARNECELNQRLLRLAADMKMDAAREVGDAWLKSLKVEVRGHFIAFITDHYSHLQRTIEARREDFAAHIRYRYQILESHRDIPALARRYEQSINEEIEDHIGWLDELLIYFKAIVQERIADFERPSLPPKS